MANLTTTTGANLVPELWSVKTQDFREKALIFANLVDKGFTEASGFGDTINVPGIAEIATAAKVADTPVTFTANTESTTQILINRHFVFAVLLEKILKVQSQVDYQSKIQGQGGYVLGKQVDADLAALIDDFTQTGGTLAVANTDEEIREAIKALMNADAPEENMAFGFSPAAWMALQGIDKYMSQDYLVAKGIEGTARGQKGTLYGIPVYVSTHIEGTDGTGHDNFLLQMEALACVIQQDVEVIVEESADHVGWKIVGSNIFGVKEMRDNHGYWLKGP